MLKQIFQCNFVHLLLEVCGNESVERFVCWDYGKLLEAKVKSSKIMRYNCDRESKGEVLTKKSSVGENKKQNSWLVLVFET